MAFYGEYSVRVTHYFALSTETRVLTEHMAQFKSINQSAKTKAKPGLPGAKWLMTIDCHAGTGWLPRGRHEPSLCSVLSWFWINLVRAPYLDFNY